MEEDDDLIFLLKTRFYKPPTPINYSHHSVPPGAYSVLMWAFFLFYFGSYFYTPGIYYTYFAICLGNLKYVNILLGIAWFFSFVVGFSHLLSCYSK